MAKYKKKPTQETTFCNGNYFLIPILIVIFFIPLIVRGYGYDSGLSVYKWFPNKTTEEMDIFLYWKGICLILTATTMLILLLISHKKVQLKELNKPWIYLILSFAALALVSTILSDYKNYGFSGIYEQFESVWVIISYCVVTIYCYLIMNREQDLRPIRKAIWFLLMVSSVLGLLQMVGADFFETKLGRNIMIPSKYAEFREGLVFNFAGTGIHQVYMTLYNPNYVGVFTTLLLPISLVMCISNDNAKNRISWIIISLALFISTLGSGSKTFLLALFAVVALAILVFRRYIFKHIKPVIVSVLLIVVCSVIYFASTNVNLFQYVGRALTLKQEEYNLTDVQMNSDHVQFTYKGNILKVSYYMMPEGTYFTYMDESGTLLDSYVDGVNRIVIADERFEGLSFGIYSDENGDNPMAAAIVNNTPLYFKSTEQGYVYINAALKEDKIVQAESSLFTGYESFASGRGYIWSRTIPLLKDYLILGSGADSFSLVFPQNDYLGKFNAGYNTLIVTRPHNMYLQIGVQQGMLSLVIFLLVCAIYLLQSIKLYWKINLNNRTAIFGVGIMLGIFGYLISGIANDSTVAVAPLFWALLGIGFAVNRMCQKRNLTEN